MIVTENDIQLIFENFDSVRYVAIYLDGQLVNKQRFQVHNASYADSDRVEELFINPSLLTLASQRGNIDCGGLRYIIIAYGNFQQVIKEVKGGHISICLTNHPNAIESASKIIEFIEHKILSNFIKRSFY